MRREIWSSEPKSIISVMRIRGKEWRELYPWKYMIESRRWIISIGLDFRIWELSSCTSRFLQFFLREEFFLIWKGILFYFFGRIFRHKKALTEVNARIRWMFFRGWIPAYAGMTETKVGAWQKSDCKRRNKKSGSTSTMWVSAKILITSFPQIIPYLKRAGGCKTALTRDKFLREKMKNERRKIRILASLVYRESHFLKMEKSEFSFLIILHFSLWSLHTSRHNAPLRISSEIPADSPDREG